MADRFNLTAQLQLQAPTNTRQVVNDIRRQLQGINVNVQVQANARAINQVNAGLQNTNRQANNAARSVGFLNRNLSEAARRFGVITLATGTMLSFAQSVKRAVGEAIEFERELVRISQTTGKSVKELSDLSNEVTRLATSLGTSSSSLLQTANILAQAGFSAKTTKQALDILAKTTLGPTFDDVNETVEGAVSVLSQFRQEAIAAGGDIKFLESTLDAINSVSKAFAVESSDLITVIRRTGGVFAAAGGSVNELISLFTSVRATTRESAETIATGLRTIFTRIQRTDTVNQLEELGIQLRDAQGNFVGAFEAVKRLSVGLSAIDPRNYRFSQIIEELGGFRQIGKVIPLIQQFAVAQDALNVAQAASGSVAEDALTAQQSLAVQATKVREEFAALIRTLTNSETFRGLAAGALQLASALIKIGEALEPVLPLLTSLLALKIGQGLAPGLAAIAGFGGGRRRAFGGVVRGFARGGYVPGSGNRDTVPAMLQPGEFVIRKSSAEKLGSSTLTAMNENRFRVGGIAKAPLVDDIAQATGSVLPKPSSAIQSLISAGGGAVDIDRTLKRTVGDTAYMNARTKSEQEAVLARYFRDPQKRLQDIKSAPITQFGKELQSAIKSGSLRANAVSIISKSQRTPGVPEYLSQLFGIPVSNMIFTQGGSKQPAIDALRAKGPRSERIRKFFGGTIQKFQDGGEVREELARSRDVGVGKGVTLSRGIGKSATLIGALTKAEALSDVETYGAAFLRPVGSGETFTGENNPQEIKSLIQNSPGYKALQGLNKGEYKIKGVSQPIKAADQIINRYAKNNKYNLKVSGLGSGTSESLEDTLLNGVINSIQSGVKVLEQNLAITGPVNTAAALKQANIDQTIGNLFESVLTFAGSPYGGNDRDAANAPFDFPYGLGNTASKFPGLPNNIQTDAKSTYNAPNVQSIIKKVNNKNLLEAEGEIDPIITEFANSLKSEAIKGQLLKTTKNKFFGGRIGKYANGGNVDTVPSLLTPGEFVINKKSAQSIGYSNLHRMNQTGVSKFNTGGVVGVQKFATGTGPTGVKQQPVPSTLGLGQDLLSPKDFAKLQAAVKKNTDLFNQLGPHIEQMGADDAAAALKSFTRSVNAGASELETIDKVITANAAPPPGSRTKTTPRMSPSPPVGVSESRAAGSVGVRQFQASGDAVARAQKELDSFSTSAQATKKGMLVFTTTLRQTGDESAALAAAYRATSQVIDDSIAAAKKVVTAQNGAAQSYQKQAQSTGPTLIQRGVGAIKEGLGTREGLQAGAQRLGDIAGAAQQFAFLAGSAAALGSQFGGLNETTSKAISETAAYSASLVGVGGTVVQMFTSLFTSGVQQTASTTSNSVSQQACASATAQNATAQSSAAKAGAGLAQGFAIGALAAVAVSSGFKYLAATAQAEADSLKKAADEQLAAIEKGTGSVNLFADNIVKAAQKAGESKAYEAGAAGALKFGLAGAAAGATLGLALGPVGSAVGGLVGGLLGAAVGLVSYNTELSKQQAIAAKFGAELERSAQGLGTLVQAQTNFEQSLQDIEAAGLKPEEQVSRRLTAQTDVAGVNQSELTNAQKSLSSALSEVAKRTNKSVSELTEADFKEFPLFASQIEISRQTISRATDGLAKDVAESRKTLQEAAKLELTGDVSLDELLKDPASQVAQALRATESAIAAETRARIASLQQNLVNAKSDAERASITKQINSEQNRYKQRINDGREALSRQAEEAKKNKEAIARATAAQEAYRQELLRISSFTNALVGAEEKLRKLEQSLGNLSNYISGDAFDVSRLAPAGLDDLSQVGNRKTFEKEVNAIAADLGPAGQLLANKVITTSRAIDIANRELTNVEFGQGFTSEDFLNRLGINKDMLGGAKDKFEKAFQEAMIDGRITEEEMKQLLEPIANGAKESSDALKKAVEIQNKQLSLYQNYLNQLQQQRDKEIAARQSLTDILLKGAELRAEARGQKLSPEQREAFRQQRAQQGLQGITDVAGRQLRAGDVSSISARRLQADQERFGIQQQLKGGNLGDKERKILIARDRELANVVAKTTDELNRLTDQSGRASDILGEIDKERGKRETITGIIEDFVVGGREQRLAINQAFAGIQNAMATGTLQGQTPEQRKATIDMLDKLGDIAIPGAGGMLGKEVKQKLIFEDAIRMGLDPRIARQLATATTKEEQLINALDALTREMQNAAKANVDLEAQRRRNIELQAPEMVPPGAPPIPPGGRPIPSAPPPVPQPDLAEQRRRKLIEEQTTIAAMPVGQEKGERTYGFVMARRKEAYEQEMLRRRTAAGIINTQNQMGQGPVAQQQAAPMMVAQGGPQQGAIAQQQPMGFDVNMLNNTFNNFIGSFSGIFDNIVKSFSGIQASFTSLAQSMSNITMEHTVNVEGLISVGGLNLESIKSELSSSIGQMVAMEVQRTMDEQRKNFRAG